MLLFLSCVGIRQNYILFISLMITTCFFGCKNKEEQQEDKKQYQISAFEDKNHLKELGQEEEWRLLFDGETTAGWRGINQETFPNEGWQIKDGQLMVNATDGKESGNGGDIITIEQFGDFVLDWEWKMLTKGGNSGVKYFVKEGLSENEQYGAGLEYQILDDTNHPWMLEGKMQPGDYHTLASLYEIYPAVNKSPKPLGEWNHSRIVAKDNHVEHWLNGTKVLEYERGSENFKEKVAESKFHQYKNFGEARRGHILLQDHGSRVAFRNIKIKESE